MDRFETTLRTRGSVTAAIEDAGFASSSRAYAQTNGRLGMTPSRFRKGAPGLAIWHAIERTSLGWLLVAATDRGICAIEFADSKDALRAMLRARFPRANHVPAEPEFAATVARVIALVEDPMRGARGPVGQDLPLDVRGTAFQVRVWQAMRRIPAGSTESYSAVAARIGMPKAARAVARACAANPLAVAVPCHRVVCEDGSLAGFRSGMARRRELLRREGVVRQERRTATTKAASAATKNPTGGRGKA